MLTLSISPREKSLSFYPEIDEHLADIAQFDLKLDNLGNVDVRGAYQIVVGYAHFVAVEVGYGLETEETVDEMAQGALCGERRTRFFSVVSWGMWGTTVFSKAVFH